MEWTPDPPPCAACGGKISVWEPISVDQASEIPSTSWVAITELGIRPDAVRHLDCAKTQPSDGPASAEPPSA